MLGKIVNSAIGLFSSQFGLEAAMIKSFVEVETGGKGFDEKNGKLIIQFEPAWFRRNEPYAPSGKWSVNGVERQEKEWIAFNDAWKINPVSAMLSTSIGLGQIMGFNFNKIGYKAVGDMWDEAKKGEELQVYQLCKYISYDSNLKTAMKDHDFTKIATIYNGSEFKEMAKKWGRESYDISLRKAYEKYK